MARTKRNYGWKQSNYERTRIGLGFVEEPDHRNAFENGYDGYSPSYYYWKYHSYDRDNYRGKTRKFLKRQFAKSRRREKWN